jgi:hypothetical protein
VVKVRLPLSLSLSLSHVVKVRPLLSVHP